MARGRKNKKDGWLPTRVYRGKTKYEYHPKEGGSISLCPLDAPRSKVWEAYEKATSKRIVTVKRLHALFTDSPKFKGWKPKTQALYDHGWKKIEAFFGHMDITKVEPKTVREYMDIRGEVAPVAANRERSFLQAMFGHAYQRGMVGFNPCKGVDPFPEPGRDRYIEDDEYQALIEHSSPIIQVFMELAYICAARGQDVRKILLSDRKPEGLLVVQAKTGKKQIKRWNDRLRAAVDQAMQIRDKRLKRRGTESIYLIVTNRGEPYSENGLKALWAHNRTKAREATGLPLDFTFHDLKAKGISDYEGDKQTFSGHKSRSNMERYNRSPDPVDVIDFRRDIRKDIRKS